MGYYIKLKFAAIVCLLYIYLVYIAILVVISSVVVVWRLFCEVPYCHELIRFPQGCQLGREFK